jgi:hypothetical protein
LSLYTIVSTFPCLNYGDLKYWFSMLAFYCI